MISPVVGFVGMTHLGLVSGVAASEKGFQVVCFDPDADRIARLGRGDLPVNEPQLDMLFISNAQRLTFSSDPATLAMCDVVYVAPDVATDDAGDSDLTQITTLLKLAFQAARPDAVIVVLSQVPPGFTRSIQLADRAIYYQVETLVFGNGVERALHPERYIVGCANPSAPLPKAYATFLAAHSCPVLPMQFESAELAKISINMCLVASVNVANTLAELCENIGANWAEIVPALKLDRRIGAHAYLTPGLGIAGGNLERDLATVCKLADHHGTDAGVVHAWMVNSKHRKNWPWRILQTLLLNQNSDAHIGVLGLAYKADTHSTKNSPALELLSHLKDHSVRVYDPVVAHPFLNSNIAEVTSALSAIAGADAVCVMTPWNEFKEMDIAEIARTMRGNLVIDPYGVFQSIALTAYGLRHVTLGAQSASIQ